MSQPDIIGVNEEWFNVTVIQTMNDPALRRKTLQRLDVMRREAEHAMRAIDVMRHELSKERPFPSTQLAHALKQSRDWVLSLVISQAYIISMNSNFVLMPPSPHFGILFNRAVEPGIKQATSDPDRRAWIHNNL
ncbi:hypothetical protein SAMN05519104_7871 [Rhizobiales bacterium GAS188]|nr:hypothetical protein SAMN05519104_7871 [Rhizobiales bacterium GAS188]